jgi:hypothetical protein
MSTGKKHHWWYRAFIFVCVLGIMSGCDSSSSPTNNNGCTRQGRYMYTHYRSLEHAPTSPGGAEIIAHVAYTQVGGTSNGFFFSGGDFNAWEIQATCIDANSASVEIALNNRCVDSYITTATSTLEISGNGTIMIDEYFIQWTCGTEVSYMAKEWWVLKPVDQE